MNRPAVDKKIRHIILASFLDILTLCNSFEWWPRTLNLFRLMAQNIWLSFRSHHNKQTLCVLEMRCDIDNRRSIYVSSCGFVGVQESIYIDRSLTLSECCLRYNLLSDNHIKCLSVSLMVSVLSSSLHAILAIV